MKEINPWYIVALLLVVIVILFLTRGDDGAKDRIEELKAENKALEAKIDDLEFENRLLDEEVSDYYNQVQVYKDSVDYIRNQKTNVRPYFQQKRDSVLTYNATELEQFFADRYPERQHRGSPDVESAVDSN